MPAAPSTNADPAATRRHRRRWQLGLGLALLATFPFAWLARDWIVSRHVPVCTFLLLTGRPCPFCGLTRAFAYATHGEFVPAYQVHPFWYVAVALVLSTAALLVTDAARGTNHAQRVGQLAQRRWYIWAPVLVLFTLWRVLR